MKKIKKIAALTLISLMAPTAYSNTNWAELTEEARSAVYENVKLDDLGYVEMSIAKLSNDRLRFMGFKSYGNSTMMNLTIHSSKGDVGKACADFLNYKKGFEAELTFGTSPIGDEFLFVTADGKKRSSSEFENPFSATELEASALLDASKLSWTINSGELKKFREVGVKIGFANLLNEAIKNRTNGLARLDLSKYNGIACDLAFGNIQPELTKTFIFEKSLPDASFWISKENYFDLYRNYWDLHHKLIQEKKSIENTSDKKESEFVLLGMILAQKDIEKENIFKKGRVHTLLNSIKFRNSVFEASEMSVIDPTEQWKQSFEYSIPLGDKMVKQKKIVQFGKVNTVIME